MKTLFVCLLFCLTWPATSAFAQELDEAQSKNLFRTSASTHPGVQIRIELLRNGQRQFVPVNTPFFAGDKVKLHFEVNFPAYVEIFNYGTNGQLDKLFPYPGMPTQVRVTAPYVVPMKATEWFEFDNTPGTEKLAFLFSAAPPPRRAARRPAAGQRQGTTPPAPRPKPIGGSVAINPDDDGNVGGRELGFGDSADEAMEEGKNLVRVQTKVEQYVFVPPLRLQKVLGVVLELQHN